MFHFFRLSPRGLSMILALTFGLSMGSGCGSGSTYPSQPTGCGTGAALIGVGDGYLEILCGCAEAAGTLSTTAGGLTCTVTSGNSVVFQYIGPTLRHQILSTTTGGQTFPSSPVMDPKASSPIVRAHGIRPAVAGTYTFTDAFNSNLSGQVVAL